MPSYELRLASFWKRYRDRLDTAEMQAKTGAPGRVYVVHLAPPDLPPAGASQSDRWGRVLIIPGRYGFPMRKYSSLLRRVYFRVVTQVNDWAPPEPEYAATYDPFVDLERMQAEVKRLTDRWRADVQGYMRVVTHVWLEEDYDPVPDKNEEQHVHELSALYAFEAAAVAVL